MKGKAYIWDGDAWVLSKNKIDYPEGAFVGFLDDGEGDEDNGRGEMIWKPGFWFLVAVVLILFMQFCRG